MKSSPSSLKLIGLVGVLLLVMISGFVIISADTEHFEGFNAPYLVFENNDYEMEPFANEAEFLAYISDAQALAQNSFGFGVAMPRMMADDMAVLEAMPSMVMDAEAGSGGATKATVDRFSGTNVQVQGIDEPDIVKTNGEELFVSTPYYGPYPVFFETGEPVPRFDEAILMEDAEAEIAVSSSRIAPPARRGGVKVVQAFPPADLAISGEIDLSGDLLLHEDILMVFSGDLVTAFDVSNPSDPRELWEHKLDSRSRIVTSRLMGDSLYVVTSTWIHGGHPCPIMPLSINGDALTVPCERIFRPASVVPVDSTYTVLKIDPETGRTTDTISLIGSQGQTVVYMSPEALYITQQQPADVLPFITGFFFENSDLVPSWVTDRLSRLMGYDIGRNAKMAELSDVLSRFQNSLSDDDRVELENELANRMADYYERHKRNLSATLISKVSLTNRFEVAEDGAVPGRLLNQFSLDEHDGHLRVATTIDQQWFGFGGLGIGRGGESTNDLYVLDDNLTIVGSIKDMGRDERIFSARFMGDKGYLVTFKQIDPFFTLDLSDHKNPRVVGELKIPGFSSYLHPLKGNMILGVGREDSRVKLSLFDVTNPADPQERSKYLLTEYWSEVQNTHHAFLQDADNELFFIPGGQAGYIFSYAGDDIRLEKAVAGLNARRAVFINNYLYVIGNESIVVINLQDFERVNELSLN